VLTASSKGERGDGIRRIDVPQDGVATINTPRSTEDQRTSSAVLGGVFENPATALAVGGERRESVAFDIGAFVPVAAAALTLVDAAGEHELAGPERCAVLNHEVPFSSGLR
jgi:hypothetical protein